MAELDAKAVTAAMNLLQQTIDAVSVLAANADPADTDLVGDLAVVADYLDEAGDALADATGVSFGEDDDLDGEEEDLDEEAEEELDEEDDADGPTE